MSHKAAITQRHLNCLHTRARLIPTRIVDGDSCDFSGFLLVYVVLVHLCRHLWGTSEVACVLFAMYVGGAGGACTR